jgi:hypothetical protein
MDGLLSHDQHLAFESHLSNCDQCLKKLIESFELIQDPTLDTQKDTIAMPDVSKITRWIGEQLSGIFSWRPQCEAWRMFAPALQPIRYRNDQNNSEMDSTAINRDSDKHNAHNLQEMDSTAIKVMHNRFPAQLRIQKQNDQFKLWIQIRKVNASKKPIFIILSGDNQYENSQNFTNKPVVFEQVPFGRYSIVVETMEDEDTIFKMHIDAQQVKRISP